MPSASTKADVQAPQDALDPIKKVLTVVDKKVRNLEKRKVSKIRYFLQKINLKLNRNFDLTEFRNDAYLFVEICQTQEIINYSQTYRVEFIYFEHNVLTLR